MPGQIDQSDEIEDPKIVIGKASRGFQHEDLQEEESRLGVPAGEGIALCLSGGGIRSATFSLGVIQTLAKLGWLERFTHLSTVSGGGYIGSWLTSWIRRIKISGVVEALKAIGRPEPEEIRRLRASSNYLSPQGGISADLLALVSTFLRNLLINWAILIPLLVVLTMIPLINVGIAEEERVYTGWGSDFLRVFFAVMAVIFVTIALAYTASDVPDGNAHQTRTNRYREFVFFPVLVACFLVSLALVDMVVAKQPAEAVSWWLDRDFAIFAGIGAGIHLVAVSIGTYLLRDWRKHFEPANYEPVPKLLGKGVPGWLKQVSLLIFLAISGAFSGAVAYLGMRLARSGFQAVSSHATYAESWSAVYSTLAVPYLLLCFFLGTVLHVALIRRNTDEGAREWWGRSGGTWILLAVAWIAVHVICIWVPHLLSRYGASVVGGSGALGGVLVAVIGYYSKHKPDPKQAKQLDFLERLNIGVLDLLSLAFIISLVAAICLAAVDFSANLQVPAEAIPSQFFGDLNVNTPWKLIALLVAGIVALAFSWAAGVNAFSMHAMYGNRLARAYLGATRPVAPEEKARMPHAYTGFDPDDDQPLAESREESSKALQRPFHVINTALNIVRASADHLEWQERKAASFTMTSLRTGSRLTGYCRTRQIGGRAGVNPDSILPSGLTIGRSMTISGAAAAPNMGYHSSRLVAIVMTFFNVRLGWWMRNPAPLFSQPPSSERTASYEGLWGKAKKYVSELEAKRARGQRSELISQLCQTEPSNPIRALISELTGDTRENSDYVYLSDGGHFENLGLYEMVRRRCAEIVLVDAGCDPKYEYEDLERAIRIIRNDLNAEINIPDLPTAESIEQTGRHYAIGTITYKNAPDGENGKSKTGKILYIKPGLSWKEPLDVTRYAKRSRANGEPFPHQSTADQFFDEPQFESYRALGQYSVESLAIAKVATIAGLEAALVEQAAKAKAEGANAPEPPAPAAAAQEVEKSGGGLLETLSGLLSWDKLPGLVAAALGTTGMVNYFMPKQPETPAAETQAVATDDNVTADNPPSVVDDSPDERKVVLIIPVRGFEEGQLCRTVGKTCNDGARLSRGVEQKLSALDRKLATCGPSAKMPLTFTVLGFASSSEFGIRRVSASNERRQEPHPESDRLNLSLADARARVVAMHLGQALAINSNKSDNSLSLWLSKSNAADAATLRQRREDMLDQLDIDSADGAYDRAAGVENRRVEIRFESLGGCQPSELIAVMRLEPRRAAPTVAAR